MERRHGGPVCQDGTCPGHGEHPAADHLGGTADLEAAVGELLALLVPMLPATARVLVPLYRQELLLYVAAHPGEVSIALRTMARMLARWA